MHRINAACLILAALLPAARPAVADEPAEEPTPELEDGPTEQPAPSEEPPDDDQITVTAPAPDDPERSVAVRRVLSRADLPPVTDPASALGALPGVDPELTGGPEDWSTVRIRGAEPRHLRVQVDGAGRGGSRAFDLSAVPLEQIERIELTPAGASRGSPRGGTLNIVLRSDPGIFFSARAGSFATWGFSAGVVQSRGAVSGRVLVSGSGSRGTFRYFNDRGTRFNSDDDRVEQRDNNDSRRLSARADLSVQGLRLGVHWQDRERGLPGAVGRPTPSVRMRHRTGGGGISWKRSAARWVLDLGLELHADDYRFADPEGFLVLSEGTDGEQLGAADAVGRLSLQWTGSQLSHLDLRGGADWWSNRLLSGVRPRLRAELGHSAWFLDDRLAATAWVALDLLDQRSLPDGPPSLPGGGAVQRRVLAPVTGGGGLRFELREDLWIRFTGRAGMRAPDLSELFGTSGVVSGNPGLLPERGGQLELGLTGRVSRGALSWAWDATAFVSAQNDLVVWVQNPARVSRPVNLGRARTVGAELSGTMRVRFLSAGGALTAQSPSNLDPRAESLPAALLPGRSMLRTRLWIGAAADPVKVNLSWSFQGIRYHDLANLDPSPPRHGLDLSAEVRLTPGLRLSLRLNNLLNTRSGLVPINPADPEDPRTVPVPIDDRAGFPLPGRSIHLGLEGRLPFGPPS